MEFFQLGEGLGLVKSNGFDCAQPGNFALFIHVKNRSKFRVAHIPQIFISKITKSSLRNCGLGDGLKSFRICSSQKKSSP